MRPRSYFTQLSIFSHFYPFKRDSFIFKVFNPPGYMVGRCGEYFCEQVKRSGSLCCQVHWILPKNLSSYRPYQSLYVLRTNFSVLQSKPWLFSESSVQYCQYFNMWAFIACLSNICVRVEMWKKPIIQGIKQLSDCFYVTVPSFCMSPTHTGTKLVPPSRGTSFEVFSLNAGTKCFWKSTKRDKIMSTF